MSTTTTNYSLKKIEASDNPSTTVLTNQALNMDAIDAQMKANEDAASGGGGDASDMAKIYNDSSQSIPDSEDTPVVLNSVEYDENSNLTGTTNAITIDESGYYSIKGELKLTLESGGVAYVAIKVNGTTVDERAVYLGIVGARATFAFDQYLTATNVVTMYIYQDSGGAINLTSSFDNDKSLSVHRLKE